ncbi:Ldh family oxidoreductase [Sporosarcina luteola]|uniref:Ldh family oxidoreductase n=1 Tax=Sporosarcina luteola TaxID=582850 RepID=UPI002040D46F|nr:Ldh family oxidoreductase [Sporosarcina luteola]MCM3709143.1 Ldh family oxidoreductase [Sporosarcina luteola]
MAEMITVRAEVLRDYCSAIFAESIPEEEARIVSDNLVEADLLGFYSHGVCKVADYLKRFEDGLIEGKTNTEVITETATTAVLDAKNGWGQVASIEAMNMAVEKAVTYGTGFVGVRNSNHFGITSYYTKLAAEKGCIGFATTNASSLMVPFGSKTPSLGTNPISFAIPVGPGHAPVVVDMSTGNTARGKITHAYKTGTAIPKDWAITKDGRETTDPKEALDGYLLPMGPKGSGLAMVVDILSGVLTGSLFGSQVPRMYEDPVPQQIGHFFGAINIEAFMPLESFYESMQERVRQTIESEPMAGFERVYMPGQIEEEKKQHQLENGIELPIEIIQELEEVGKKYGLKLFEYQ